MAKYATGKYAKAISDRSGMEFPYKEMLREWNGSLVHVSEYPVHYQLKQVFEFLASELFLAIDGKLLPANGLFL